MRKKIILLGLLLMGIITQIGWAQPKNWYDSANIRIDNLRKGNYTLQILDKNGNPVIDSIKVDMYKHHFVFGIAMDPESNASLWAWEKATMYRYYNAGVSGNSFKWSAIEAQKNVLTYQNFETILNWCESVGWTLKGHTLLWNGREGNYHEVPRWVQELPTSETVKEACKTRVIRDVTRYKGRVFEYDVMNEPSHTFYLTNRVGDSINWLCFKWARQADSSAQLYVNDYNLIEWDEYPAFVALVRKMLQNGAPVDGIGIQGHFGGSIVINDVKRRLDKLAELGLPMRITEFDMSVTASNVTPLNQAINYARMLRIAFSYPKITGFYFWGMLDGKVWREGSGIFYSNKEPKPAADSVYNLIHKEWSTHEKGITDADGKFTFRGFFGDYYVFAKINGQWKEFRIKCSENLKNTTIVLNENDAMIPRPRLIKGRVVAPRKVELTFDKKMADPSAQINGFEVFARIKNPVVAAYLKENDSCTIVLDLKNDLLFNNYVVASYMQGTQVAADTTPLDIFGATPIENMIPGIVAAHTNADGTQIIVRLNKNMKPLADNNQNIKILVNNQVASINNIEFKDDSASVLLITLDNPITSSTALIYFNYTPGNWTSTEDIILPATGNIMVVNKIPNDISPIVIDDMQIYPNPVVDYCTIKLIENYDKIVIYNMLGREVMQIKTSQPILKLDLRQLNEGIYFVRVVNSINDKSKTFKINKIK